MRFIENEILERIGFDFIATLQITLLKPEQKWDEPRRSWQSSQESNPIGWWELKT